MISELTALGVLAVMALAEWLHARRTRRLARLAFGDAAAPRAWTVAIAPARCLAAALLAWGFLQLWQLPTRESSSEPAPTGGYRHLLILLDVSPSMQLKDAGPDRQQTRMQRAGEVLLSMLARVPLEEIRLSVIAVYNGAKPVVIDTRDLELLRNILNDLPLDYAFTPGKTRILDGLREAADVARDWRENSTTVLLVSDGDTVPDTGMPSMPRSVTETLVIGVGDTRTGRFIDGHQSRQDASTLQQIAARLGGTYQDANTRQIASTILSPLLRAPDSSGTRTGLKELAVLAIALGAAVLAIAPLALAFAGSEWQPETRRVQRSDL